MHPMFGLEGKKGGWAGLPFVYDRVRISHGGLQAQNCDRFLKIFKQEGCRMMEMSCEEHDEHAAFSLFIPHIVGRTLSRLNVKSTSMDTKGYESLLKLTENTVRDNWDLLYGLFMYNVNAVEQIDNLDKAFDTLKHKLFESFDEMLQKQLVERVPFEGLRAKTKESANFRFPLSDSRRMKSLSFTRRFPPVEEIHQPRPRAIKPIE